MCFLLCVVSLIIPGKEDRTLSFPHEGKIKEGWSNRGTWSNPAKCWHGWRIPPLRRKRISIE